MEILNSLRRFLMLKNNLISSTKQKISQLRGDIFGAEAILIGGKDEKIFSEDFKWLIRIRGFTLSKFESPQISSRGNITHLLTYA